MTDVLKTIEMKMIAANPELSRAPEHKRKAKAKRSVVAVLLSFIAVLLLAGGGFLAWRFASSAIAQNQAVGMGLLSSLLIPLVPGGVVGAFALLRFDPDAGGVFQQLLNIVGAAKAKVTGHG